MKYIFTAIETSRNANEVLKSDKPAIIRITALAIDANTQVINAKFDQKIKFKTTLADQYILSKTSYHKELWDNEAKLPIAIANNFVEWLKHYRCIEDNNEHTNIIMAGHNVKAFTIPVLINWYKALDNLSSKPINNLPVFYTCAVDTLELANVIEVIHQFNQCKSKGLLSLCDYYGIEETKSKVHASYELWKKLIFILEEGNKVF